jgi:hypothetical protein
MLHTRLEGVENRGYAVVVQLALELSKSEIFVVFSVALHAN